MRSWHRIGLVMTHTFVSNRTCLSLSQWGTHKANHNQSTWCAWPTSMRAVRQAWPCNLKCIWSSLLHSPFLPVQFWPHHRPLLCPWPCGMVVPMICPTKKKKTKNKHLWEKPFIYSYTSHWQWCYRWDVLLWRGLPMCLPEMKIGAKRRMPRSTATQTDLFMALIFSFSFLVTFSLSVKCMNGLWEVDKYIKGRQKNKVLKQITGNSVCRRTIHMKEGLTWRWLTGLSPSWGFHGSSRFIVWKMASFTWMSDSNLSKQGYIAINAKWGLLLS